MRAQLFAILCISMIGYIAAEDCIMGERKEGDYIISNRTIFKPPIPWVAMKATIGMTAPTLDEVITHVNITNLGDNQADFMVLNGSVGTNSILIFATGKMGEGLSLSVEAYAISTLTTTEAPTTTEQPTIAPTTTERPETTHAPTEAPTTTEQPTITPTPTTTKRPETTPAPTTEPPTQTTSEETEGTTITIDFKSD